MNSDSLTSADLQRFIDAQHIKATILSMAEHTPTVPEAARILGVAPEQIIKSLVFLVDNQPVLIINNGLTRADQRKIADRFGVGRKKIKFASAAQALEITGYIVGSMPPFGHRRKLPTFVDPAILEFKTIFGGGGDIDAMMKLTPGELLRVTAGELLNLSE